MLKITIPVGAGTAVHAKLKPLAAQAVKDAMPKVAALITGRVATTANQSLGSMAAVYAEAMAAPGAIQIKPEGVVITLSGLAVVLESGANSFDIKTRMLAHAKKFSKSGSPYIDVPFKHAAGKEGTTVNLPGLPPEVHSALQSAMKATKARVLRAGGSAADAATATTRLKGRTQGKRFQRTLVIGGKAFKTDVEHKQGLHDDLIRTATMGLGGRAISKISTIRRISAKSAATSWWHPGFKPAGIVKRVMPDIKKDLQSILRDSFQAQGLRINFK